MILAMQEYCQDQPSNPANLCCIYHYQYSIPDLPGNKLILDDVGCVFEEVVDLSAQWYLLGIQLKVKIGTLDSIQAQFADPKRQLLAMLKAWLTTSDNTTWKILTNALRSQSVGAGQLAGELEKKYCLVKKAEVGKGMSTSDSFTDKNLATRDWYLHSNHILQTLEWKNKTLSSNNGDSNFFPFQVACKLEGCSCATMCMEHNLKDWKLWIANSFGHYSTACI